MNLQNSTRKPVEMQASINLLLGNYGEVLPVAGLSFVACLLLRHPFFIFVTIVGSTMFFLGATARILDLRSAPLLEMIPTRGAAQIKRFIQGIVILFIISIAIQLGVMLAANILGFRFLLAYSSLLVILILILVASSYFSKNWVEFIAPFLFEGSLDEERKWVGPTNDRIKRLIALPETRSKFSKHVKNYFLLFVGSYLFFFAILSRVPVLSLIPTAIFLFYGWPLFCLILLQMGRDLVLGNQWFDEPLKPVHTPPTIVERHWEMDEEIEGEQENAWSGEEKPVSDNPMKPSPLPPEVAPRVERNVPPPLPPEAVTSPEPSKQSLSELLAEYDVAHSENEKQTTTKKVEEVPIDVPEITPDMQAAPEQPEENEVEVFEEISKPEPSDAVMDQIDMPADTEPESEDASNLEVLDEEDRPELSADVNEKLDELFEAAALDNDEEIKKLVGLGANPNIKSSSGDFPLHLAAEKGAIQAVDALIGSGADPNKRDRENRTPLMRAIMRGGDDVAEMLLNRGANARVVDNDGRSALMLALENKSAETDETLNNNQLIKMLLTNGADVNAALPSGETPLHIAARRGDIDFINTLFFQGAKIDAAAADGTTPLQEALNAGHEFAANRLRMWGAKD